MYGSTGPEFFPHAAAARRSCSSAACGLFVVVPVVGRLQGLVRAVAAAHGGGAAHTARIEGDEVVAVGEIHEVLAAVSEFGDARAAGAAEVQQQRAARIAGAPVAGHRQVEGARPGPGVVERHGDLAAPQILGHFHALALRPLDLLLVEAGQVGLLGVLLVVGARRRGREPGPQQGQHRDRGSGERAPYVRGPHACLQGRPARAAGDNPRITIGGPSRPRPPEGGPGGHAVICAAPTPSDGPAGSLVRVNRDVGRALARRCRPFPVSRARRPLGEDAAGCGRTTAPAVARRPRVRDPAARRPRIRDLSEGAQR